MTRDGQEAIGLGHISRTAKPLGDSQAMLRRDEGFSTVLAVPIQLGGNLVNTGELNVVTGTLHQGTRLGEVIGCRVEPSAEDSGLRRLAARPVRLTQPALGLLDAKATEEINVQRRWGDPSGSSRVR